MTYCQRMRALSWLGACLVVPLAGVAAEPQRIASQASKLRDEATLDEAPAEAWPLFRGCLAGTGRSATTLAMPADTSASQQGPVRPWCEQGSSVT